MSSILSKRYLCLSCQVENTEVREILIAKLSEIGIEAFEEQPTGLLAYHVLESKLKEKLLEIIEPLSQSFGFEYSFSEVQNENWNAIWEQNFRPIQIDGFCNVRASFHPKVDSYPIDIIIDPKMSFGTGHHATTQMMIKLMRTHNWKNKHVLDLGCGTGILSILAEKLGATSIIAVDNEVWAFENAKENVNKNSCHQINVQLAEINELELSQFDYILANINKHVIVSNFELLIKHIVPKGVIFLSGILKTDKEDILQLVDKSNLKVDQNMYQAEWMALSLFNK